jgi:hypothetical protein
MLAGYNIIIRSINDAINAPMINALVDADIPAGATTVAMQGGLIILSKQISSFLVGYKDYENYNIGYFDRKKLII